MQVMQGMKVIAERRLQIWMPLPHNGSSQVATGVSHDTHCHCPSVTIEVCGAGEGCPKVTGHGDRGRESCISSLRRIRMDITAKRRLRVLRESMLCVLRSATKDQEGPGRLVV